MNKNKLRKNSGNFLSPSGMLELVEKDFLTLVNLERSINFAMNSTKGRHYQIKVCSAAFKRTCDIMLRRRKMIAKMLGLRLKIVNDPYA